MWSKNKRAMTADERRHVTRIKLMPCGVCGEGGGDLSPSEAHEIEQSRWFTAIPLCHDCHQGPRNGLSGLRYAWKVRKLEELDVLNDTIRRLFYG